MKNIWIGLVILVLCVACSEDDNTNDDRLKVATFNLVTYEIDTSLDMDNNGVSSTNLIGEIGCMRNEKLLIVSDGTGTSQSTGNPVYRESVNHLSETGISKFVSCNVNGNSARFTWNQNGNSFVTVGEGINISGTKTDTTIEFVVEDGFTFRIVNDQGEEVWLTEDVIHRYELEEE